MRRIAITGGVAEGKSTVLGYLASAGLQTASADVIARDVFAGDEVQSWIRGALGPQGASREFVRESLARDPAFRRALNARTHPLIAERIVRGPAAIVEVPLLVEACLQGFFDRVWVVTCGREEQVRRLAIRLGDLSQAEALVTSQLATRAKCAFADRVFRTNLPEADVLTAVMEAAKLDSK